MRSSNLTLRLLLSLLVILAAAVCTVTADNTAKPEKTEPAKDKDSKDDKDSDPDNDKPTGGKTESDGAARDDLPRKKQQIIEQAPEVELLNDGDIDSDGDCKDDVDDFCHKVKPGSSHLAECLQNRIEDEEDSSTTLSGMVSKKCKEVVIEYKMKLATNINYDTDMAHACKSDAKELCADLDDVQADGKIITCLRERKPQLSAKCRDHITRAQLEAAKDYRIDAGVYDFCKLDAYKFCKDVEAGSGRVNACLRKHGDEIQYDCKAALFRMDMENADDIRLNTVLFKACLNDKRMFCPNVFPGNGRAEICLEEHMTKPGFTAECKAALEERIEKMSRDYRLDPIIRTACKPQVRKFCSGQDESLQGTMDTSGTVMDCLKMHHDELKPRACKDAVARAIQRSAKNPRYAFGIASSCQDDREKLCPGLRKGDARVINCLQQARSKLSRECSADLFSHEVMLSESIDFNYPLQQACLDETETHCDGVPHGDARVIRCLQDGNRKLFSDKCRKELEAFEKNMGEDFRLNHRLESACEKDTMRLCHQECIGATEFQPCGGKVLHCLTEKQINVTSRACKKEIDYYIKMEVSTFGNDVILAEACRKDVDRFCAEVDPGEGRVHECLRKRRSQLSEGCAKEELRLEIQETKNFDLRPNLKKVCVQERNIFCSEVSTGSARVFRCLAHNLAKADFGSACRNEIKAKLLRRQQNWKLDVSLRNGCKADAAALCADVDHDADKADVARCLISYHANLTDTCAHEVSRATYMALNVYQDEGPITQVCAEDVEFCKNVREEDMERTGSVISCFEGLQKSASGNSTKPVHELDDACAELFAVAKPPDAHEEFESNLKAIARMDVKQKLSKVGMWDNRKGVTITGYTALACFSALCTSVAMGLIHLYKRWRGIRDDGYVQVVKRGDL